MLENSDCLSACGSLGSFCSRKTSCTIEDMNLKFKITRYLQTLYHCMFTQFRIIFDGATRVLGVRADDAPSRALIDLIGASPPRG